MGVPKGFILSLLLYSLSTFECIVTHQHIIVKFADETVLVGLISVCGSVDICVWRDCI